MEESKQGYQLPPSDVEVVLTITHVPWRPELPIRGITFARVSLHVLSFLNAVGPGAVVFFPHRVAPCWLQLLWSSLGIAEEVGIRVLQAQEVHQRDTGGQVAYHRVRLLHLGHGVHPTQNLNITHREREREGRGDVSQKIIHGNRPNLKRRRKRMHSPSKLNVVCTSFWEIFVVEIFWGGGGGLVNHKN